MSSELNGESHGYWLEQHSFKDCWVSSMSGTQTALMKQMNYCKMWVTLFADDELSNGPNQSS